MNVAIGGCLIGGCIGLALGFCIGWLKGHARGVEQQTMEDLNSPAAPWRR